MSNTNERPSRRLALLGDRPGSYAIARHVRMSAQKVRRVADTVRGMDAKQAIATLRFAPQAASEPVRKVVESAVANAENAENLRAEELFVSQIFVDEGVTMRRIRARAKGSASRILKRSSHITAVVEPRPAKQPTAGKTEKATADAATDTEAPKEA
ncbi:MAG: 50S ribosomal protein L22 [Propionibacterium sp.]